MKKTAKKRAPKIGAEATKAHRDSDLVKTLSKLSGPREYALAHGNDQLSLEHNVNEHMSMGFEPRGGVSYAQGEYIQAMVK